MIKQNLKIHVKSEEESRQAQECLFEMGYAWRAGCVQINHTCKPYLFADSDGRINYNSAHLADHFEKHSNKQVTLQELREMAYSNLISGEEAKKAWANGENVEVKYQMWDNWIELSDDFNLGTFGDNKYSFRLKPQTIKIGNIDVPKPESEPLKDGVVYYVPEPTYEKLYSEFRCEGDEYGKRLLARGQIHLTADAAITHAKALILVSGGSVEE